MFLLPVFTNTSAVARARVHAVMRSSEEVPVGRDPRERKKYHQKPFVSKVGYQTLQ